MGRSLTGVLGAEDGVEVVAEGGGGSAARESEDNGDGVLHLDGDSSVKVRVDVLRLKLLLKCKDSGSAKKNVYTTRISRESELG